MKILVSDFDQTFYRDNYYSNIIHVNKFVDEGNIFVIATGRNIHSLLKDIGNTMVKYDYIICNDGAVIFNNNLEEIFRRDIDPSIVDGVYYMLKESDIIKNIFLDDGIKLVDEKVIHTNGIISRYEDYLEASKLLDKIINIYPQVHGYLSENWVNITNHQVSKGSAIDYLVNTLNWDTNNLFVAGDNINDISMFERYKGFAMADGHDDLKKVSYDIVNEFNHIFKLINKKRD